jgi:hypothetical protein
MGVSLSGHRYEELGTGRKGEEEKAVDLPLIPAPPSLHLSL